MISLLLLLLILYYQKSHINLCNLALSVCHFVKRPMHRLVSKGGADQGQTVCCLFCSYPAFSEICIPLTKKKTKNGRGKKREEFGPSEINLDFRQRGLKGRQKMYRVKMDSLSHRAAARNPKTQTASQIWGSVANPACAGRPVHPSLLLSYWEM